MRSLAGLIERCSLVGCDGIQFLKETYDLCLMERNDDSPKYGGFNHEHGGTPPIKSLACFDSVASLGVPGDSILAQLSNRSYKFHNTTLGLHIEIAIHILSIDKDRKSKHTTFRTVITPLFLSKDWALRQWLSGQCPVFPSGRHVFFTRYSVGNPST